MLTCEYVAMPHQSLLFQGGSAPVKNKDRLDLVVEELADTREEEGEVGRLQGLPRAVSGAVDCLVEPYTHVYGAAWRGREKERL